MHSPELAIHVARLLVLCDACEAQFDGERTSALLAGLTALREVPPHGASPLIMGLLNKTLMNGDTVEFRLERHRAAATDESVLMFKFALKELKAAVVDLHACLTHSSLTTDVSP